MSQRTGERTCNRPRIGLGCRERLKDRPFLNKRMGDTRHVGKGPLLERRPSGLSCVSKPESIAPSSATKRISLSYLFLPADLMECPFLTSGCFPAACNGRGSPAFIGVEHGLAQSRFRARTLLPRRQSDNNRHLLRRFFRALGRCGRRGLASCIFYQWS